MNATQIKTMVEKLVELSKNCVLGTFKTRIKKHFGNNIIRWGVKNSKLGILANTYRPVGLTCPNSCPFLNNGCYAQHGNVNIHQKASPDNLEATLLGIGAAIVWSQRLNDKPPIRLHTSGDFIREGEIDVEYINQLIVLVNTIKRAMKIKENKVVAYGYTAIENGFESHSVMLRNAGIHIRLSSHTNHNGTVVFKHSALHILREAYKGTKFVKCLSQTKNKKCIDCELCWQDKGCVVFDPHGSRKNAASIAANERFLS